MASVSDFFSESKSEKKCFLFEGVKKNPNLKKKEKNMFSFFFWRGKGGGGLSKCIFFESIRI